MKDDELQKAVYTILNGAGLNPDEVRVEEDGHGSVHVYIEGLVVSEDGDIVPAMRQYRVTGTVLLRGTVLVDARSEEEAHRIAFGYALAEEADTVASVPTIHSIEEVRV